MTETAIGAQMLQLVQMTALGLCMMLSFDVVNAMRMQAKWGHYKRIAADFFFAVVWGIVFCLMLIWQNHGFLRNYIMLGLLLGIAAYSILLRRHCRWVCRFAASAILWLYKWITGILLAPWKLLYRHVFRPIKGNIIRVHQKNIQQHMQQQSMEESMKQPMKQPIKQPMEEIVLKNNTESENFL